MRRYRSSTMFRFLFLLIILTTAVSADVIGNPIAASVDKESWPEFPQTVDIVGETESHLVPEEPDTAGPASADHEQPPTIVVQPKCFLSQDEQLVDYYHTCEVEEVLPHCYDIKCPENYKECVGRNGISYQLDGPDWLEEDDNSSRTWTCSCLRPSSIYWHLPRAPDGAPDYSPAKSCQLEGCENYSNEEFIRPGESVLLNGETCRCVPGQDPSLMDASTKYYLHCQQVEPEPEPESVEEGQPGPKPVEGTEPEPLEGGHPEPELVENNQPEPTEK